MSGCSRYSKKAHRGGLWSAALLWQASELSAWDLSGTSPSVTPAIAAGDAFHGDMAPGSVLGVTNRERGLAGCRASPPWGPKPQAGAGHSPRDNGRSQRSLISGRLAGSQLSAMRHGGG